MYHFGLLRTLNDAASHSLDSTHLPSLIQVLSTLLRDRSPLSIGSVAVAFDTICPTRLDLLHAHFRRLCRSLVDVDEWGQVDLLELLIRYTRTMLPRPVTEEKDGVPGVEEVDRDLVLLLSSAEPLFQSRNPAVSVNKATCVDSSLDFILGGSVRLTRVLLPFPSIQTPENRRSTSTITSHVSRSRARGSDVHFSYYPYITGEPHRCEILRVILRYIFREESVRASLFAVPRSSRRPAPCED